MNANNARLMRAVAGSPPGVLPRALYCVLLALLGIAVQTSAQQHERIARVAWLAGCWENTRAGSRTAEHWMKPEGGTMLGMSRTTEGDSTIGFELLMISEEEEGLVYTAWPSGQSETSFLVADVMDSVVAFENPEHDFPQRIIYRLKADGTMEASIEGEVEGEIQGIDIPMRRVECADRRP
jgi:hypothetical protein